MGPGWYLRRLRRMSPAEVGRRLIEEASKQSLRLTGRAVGGRAVTGGEREPPRPLSPGAAAAVDPVAGAAVVRAAEGILQGHWTTLGVRRTDLAPEPDWFLDPETGRRVPDRRFSFDVNARDPSVVGNVKNVWELSRHHHVTVLAAAYLLTSREEFALMADRHLRSWWGQNEFLRGLHWRSGIELGVRLISWTWVRRLLDGWAGAPALFEDNPQFRRCLYQHLFLLARFPSHGSSANNHLIAEAAGGFVACCAFPWFAEGCDWREAFAATLRREAVRQTFPSGLNRELATGYQGFVLELLLVAALEGEASGHPLGPEVQRAIVSMTDAAAAMADVHLNMPRQGDGDEGTALLLDADIGGRWGSVIATVGQLFGRCAWWPPVLPPDVRAALWSSMAAGGREVAGRPAVRPDEFGEAGVVILRDVHPRADEVWCRCDSGPHGFLSLAAHAHADALSVEVRHGGVEILADPGTYCYQTEPGWRAYFRSTRAHNTLQLDGQDQSVPSGSFSWARCADGRTVGISGLGSGQVAEWQGIHDGYSRLRRPAQHWRQVRSGQVAEWQGIHDGYSRLRPPAQHWRQVRLDREQRILTIEDRVLGDGCHPCRLAFHLGPQVECWLDGRVARLEWPAGRGRQGAVVELPGALHWEEVRGRLVPPGGWYSPRLGVKVPTVSLFGTGEVDGSSVLVTVVEFSRAGPGTDD